ncbi:hypothetical protein WA158_006884 [Blastocystis sp. Blastoise]
MSLVYNNAAKIIQKFWDKNGSLKTLTFSNEFDNKTKLYALAYKTLKATDVLNAIYYQSSLSKQKISSRALLFVMLYDHLFGKKISGGGKLAKIIKENDKEIRDILERLKTTKRGDMDKKVESVITAANDHTQIPRFVRINTCSTTKADAIKELKKLSKDIKEDKDIPNLINIPSTLDIHDHELVTKGSLVIQSKPSCFPANILLGELPKDSRDYSVIDACAAPGNKTTHCAAILGKRGKVYACDKDKSRYELLQSRVTQMKANNVTCLNQDFLQIDEKNPIFNEARAILLDPSCSGTGMTNNILDTKMPSTDRLKKLSSFQLHALTHAFEFPNVERITYSTCSIMKEENEKVVRDALAYDIETHDGVERWKLAVALPSWNTRGVSCDGLTEDQSNCCVRCNIDSELKQGFFVALFIRSDAKDIHEDALEQWRKPKEEIIIKPEIKKEESSNSTQHLVHTHKKVRSNTKRNHKMVPL